MTTLTLTASQLYIALASAGCAGGLPVLAIVMFARRHSGAGIVMLLAVAINAALAVLALAYQLPGVFSAVGVGTLALSLSWLVLDPDRNLVQ